MRRSPQELATALTLAGLPVAAVENPGASLRGIVVGKILKIDKHAQADRLTVCRVDIGKEVLKIVCGAKNMKEQDLVPVAVVGTTLPGGQRIEQATIRGETSFGMMCSKRELGMGESHEGLFILDPATPVGKSLVEALGMDDTVLDIEVTPNRSDCLSVLGIAREIAAITNAPFRMPKIALDRPASKERWGIRIEAKEDCWMYCGCLLEDVRVGPSPAWLSKKLELVGLRSINNVVDITNFVMVGYGQPLHAFDADTLAGSQIVVRRAKRSESIKTIDQVVRSLDDSMLVIADEKRPVAVAGVMGGAETEIREGSHRVFLESALFAPVSVRKTSKKLGLSSDSSYRFERGVDSANVEHALQVAIAMLVEFAGAKPGPVHKVSSKKFSARKVALDCQRVSRLLGMRTNAAAIGKTLKRLRFGVAGKSSIKLQVTVPSWRSDVVEEADLAEEFARLEGYDKIPTTVPQGGIRVVAQSQQPDDLMRCVLLSHGFDEAVHLSFINAKRYEALARMAGWRQEPVELENPIDQEQRILRPNLVDALMGNVALNQSRGIASSLVFEIGNVFEKVSGQIQEKKSLGIAAMGPLPLIQWEGKARPFDFFDMKGALEELFDALGMHQVVWVPLKGESCYQPGQASVIESAGKQVGTLGKIHPSVAALYDLRGDVFFCEIGVQHLLDYSGRKTSSYRPMSKFPAVVRDVSIVLDKAVAVGEVTAFLRGYCGEILEEVVFFDLFDGKGISPGKRSLAFRLCYRSHQRTLTEAEVQTLHASIVESLRTKWNAELREIQTP